MIDRIVIQNFKIFTELELKLNSNVNIIVGDNEAGKSTLLEALNLCLTKKLAGRYVDYELSPFLFNNGCVKQFLESLNGDQPPTPPSILIEVYFTEDSNHQFSRGTNNSLKMDCPGVKLEIEFDDEYETEYRHLIETSEQIRAIPVEYYKVNWLTFANNPVTHRGLRVGVSNIDASTVRLQSGTDSYLQSIINECLDMKQKVALAIAYRRLKEQFSNEPFIKKVNDGLSQRKGIVTKKDLAIGIDTSTKSSWENSLIPHLNEVPFQHIGKGEQSALKILFALERQSEDSHLILIEEPENHLSFSSMNVLVSMIRDKCHGKQIVIATHSSFVLNKLGIGNLILLNDQKAAFLSSLPQDTQEYFKKLSGYDTLRLILARRVILVEGPSDELIVQKAYLMKHGRLPLDDGIDVLNVRGLSFIRFLDIAKEVGKQVIVVTDNDGNYEKNVRDNYRQYDEIESIRICADPDDGDQPEFLYHGE
jgi:putative ATP-dependent endonuclease of OLD family